MLRYTSLRHVMLRYHCAHVIAVIQISGVQVLSLQIRKVTFSITPHRQQSRDPVRYIKLNY